MQKLIFWLVTHKNQVTNWFGAIMAFFIWLNDFLLTNNVFDWWTFIQAFGAWFIAYMIGKNLGNTKNPK